MFFLLSIKVIKDYKTLLFLQDTSQVLYKACSVARGENEKCMVPIIPLPNAPACIYHAEVPSPMVNFYLSFFKLLFFLYY